MKRSLMFAFLLLSISLSTALMLPDVIFGQIPATKLQDKKTEKENTQSNDSPKQASDSDSKIQQAPKRTLTLDEIFPKDRVVDIEITVDENDWNTIRRQRRDLAKEFSNERRLAPIEGPYTYVAAKFVIDGVEFPSVGIRKKGLLGSNNPARPSLKVKLDYTDKSAEIDGLSILTLNNNNQDTTLMSQYMGYDLFNKIGSPAPRCAFAQVKVNGKNLGVYCHVESARKTMTKRGFSTSKGTLYEGTVVDFHDGWEGSFDRKFGNDKRGRKKIKELIAALKRPPGIPILKETASGRATVPMNGDWKLDWTKPEFDDSNWAEGRNGAGYERGSGFEESISEAFDFDEEIRSGGKSIYMRLPFEIEDFEKVDWPNLSLAMKFDDGFVAYLNGKKLHSVGAPRNPKWDSASAGGQGGDQTGMQFQHFDISEFKDYFVKGKNVLAVHGLNSSPQSSDMLIQARIETNAHVALEDVPNVVEMDAFYQFWAIEGLLGFWDGYSGNRNNFFVFLNPKTEKLHFMPWGADCMFQKFSYIDRTPNKPVSVKTTGILAHSIYQTESGRKRYRETMLDLLENHWDEESLLKEVDRLEKLAKPFLSPSQKRTFKPDATRRFIKNRRKDIMNEIEDGMPYWNKPTPPPIFDRR